MTDNIDDLIDMLIEFRDERDWAQFHTPKNLIMAIAGEAGELSSLAQWLDNADIKTEENKGKIRDEMADVFIYLVNLAIVMDIDLIQAANSKIVFNGFRYPVYQFKGSNKKAGDA